LVFEKHDSGNFGVARFNWGPEVSRAKSKKKKTGGKADQI